MEEKGDKMAEENDDIFEKSLSDPAFMKRYRAGLKEYDDFMSILDNQTDRIAVILAAAKIDYYLEQSITRMLLPNTHVKDELFEGDTPLSSFSSKIKLAYRLGLIDAQLVSYLNIIKKIRNVFAHLDIDCDLDTKPYKDQIDTLSHEFKKFKSYHVFREEYTNETDSSADFKVCAGMIIMHLLGIMNSVDRIKPSARSVLDVFEFLDHNMPVIEEFMEKYGSE